VCEYKLYVVSGWIKGMHARAGENRLISPGEKLLA